MPPLQNRTFQKSDLMIRSHAQSVDTSGQTLYGEVLQPMWKITSRRVLHCQIEILTCRTRRSVPTAYRSITEILSFKKNVHVSPWELLSCGLKGPPWTTAITFRARHGKKQQSAHTLELCFSRNFRFLLHYRLFNYVCFRRNLSIVSVGDSNCMVQ